MRTQIRHFMFKMGSQPDKSWRHFIVGLIIFAAGAGLIILGSQAAKHLFQLPGLLLLLVGGYFAVKGYIGIFANRFSQVLNRGADFEPEENKNNHQE
jgi:hypothetical protein